MKELLEQVEIASKSHPDLSLVDLINYVCSIKYTSSNFNFTGQRTSYKHVVTNNDILQAFKQHNKLRENNKA